MPVGIMVSPSAKNSLATSLRICSAPPIACPPIASSIGPTIAHRSADRILMGLSTPIAGSIIIRIAASISITIAAGRKIGEIYAVIAL